MRNRILLLSIVIVFFSCTTKFVEVYKTGTTSPNITIQKDSSYYLYENDTLKIAYYFWEKSGIFSFTVYNKLDRPLYIDWKKANYFTNGNKQEYWNDASISKSKTVSTSFASISKYGTSPIANVFGTSIGTSTTTTTREERITFIAPKTSITKSKFKILSTSKMDWTKDVEKIDTSRNDIPNKKTIVYVKKYSPQNSPLIIRNFMTLSLKEDFSSEFFIDHFFFVKEINNMDINNFRQEFPADPNDKKSQTIYTEYYRNGISFYLFSEGVESKKEEVKEENKD